MEDTLGEDKGKAVISSVYIGIKLSNIRIQNGPIATVIMAVAFPGQLYLALYKSSGQL